MGSPFSLPPFTLSRSRAALGIAGALLLAGGAGVGALSYHASHSPIIDPSTHSASTTDQAGSGGASLSLTQAQSAALKATATPTPSLPAGWAIEQGSAFSIKRPQGWYSAKDLGLTDEGDELTFASEKGKYPFNLSQKGIYVATGVLPASGADIYNQIFASPLGRVTLQGSFDPSNVYTKLATMQLGGYAAIEYSVDYSNNPQGQLNQDLVYVIKKGNEYYSITFSLNKAQVESYETVIESIIQSLTFSK